MPVAIALRQAMIEAAQWSRPGPRRRVSWRRTLRREGSVLLEGFYRAYGGPLALVAVVLLLLELVGTTDLAH